MANNLFDLINGWAGKSILADTLGIFFASWAIWCLVLLLVLVCWRKKDLKDKFVKIIEVIFVMALVYAINFIVGYIFFEPRPFIEQPVNLLIAVPVLTKSFPSDHAALAFVLAVFLFKLNKKLWWSFIIAVIIALARVFVGVHYPHDVLAGAVIGLLVSYLIFYLFKKYLFKLSGKFN